MAPQQQNQKKDGIVAVVIWTLILFLALGLVYVRLAIPETTSATVAVAVLLVGLLGYQAYLNQQSLRTRTAAFGINSAITVLLVIGIVAVLNFLVSRYPQKLDLTKNKIHTLSDQTVKVVKGLGGDVNATFFSRVNEREQYRALLDNYKDLNPRFHVEYVDPNKEPTRARTANVKKFNTLQLAVNGRDQLIEEPSEEKLTNALIKLTKPKTPLLCAITGHGEKSFADENGPEGYGGMKKRLQSQAYDVKDVSLVQEGKIPENCDAVAIVGPTKPFFGKDMELLTAYFAGGGRGVIALDIDVKGGSEFAPEILPLVRSWYVNPALALIVDPMSRSFGVDASAPLVPTFSRDHAITKDFQGGQPSIFPFTRPLEVVSGAPAGLNVAWIAQTTPVAWGIVDLKKLTKGAAVKQEPSDKKGPLNVAVAIEGKQKDSKAARNTRLVVFGSSFFATNQYSRFGLNEDIFLNSVSWAMEDESLISIRAKEDSQSRIEMTNKQAVLIGLLTIALVPLLIAGSGIVIWFWRRRM